MNRLINETSPYLLQHAHNPVDWYAWGSEALEKAKTENKPILVSIGYATCHWCHVMERESFENQAIANYMNTHFVCIKIDREERQDLDNIYMSAVQAMNGNGGWPLNVFLMPDTKPFYGGTYYPAEHWLHLLNQIIKTFEVQPEKLTNSAAQLTEILNRSEVEKYGIKSGIKHEKGNFSHENLHKIANSLAKHYDKHKGGMGQAPKFPMPSIYLFLLRYVAISNDENAFQQTLLTLISMAYGGIYDQIGGGFSRYATDNEWNIPHFEKMLYDNGQLISLYSEAYNLLSTFETDNIAYTEELKVMFKNVVYETIAFVKREMTGEEGNFYCALDADSEGIEGKFYVWTKDELEDTGLENIELFKKYYNVNDDAELGVIHGNWEHGYNILFRTQSDSNFAKAENITVESLQEQVHIWKKILLAQRTHRIRPILDDKTLTSWNGLMLKGLCDAYMVFGEQEFYDLAINNANFLLQNMINSSVAADFKANQPKIWHSYKNGKTTLHGYLDDYALVIQGFIAVYQISFDEKWLHTAKELADYTIVNFYDSTEKIFFYTDNHAEKLIARTKEIFDNVIPASNSIMAINLQRLALYFENADYQQIADEMINGITPLVEKEARYLSNWACLYTYYVQPTAEVAISGKDAIKMVQELTKSYYPNKVIAATITKSMLPLLVDRPAQDETLIYVCRNKACLLPTNDVKVALDLLNV